MIIENKEKKNCEEIGNTLSIKLTANCMYLGLGEYTFFLHGPFRPMANLYTTSINERNKTWTSTKG